MTIDEAISSMKYDGELMKELEEERIGHEVEYTSDEYKQFAEWLEELKAIKELDLEIPQHFTKAQSDWIKAYVILKKEESRKDAIILVRKLIKIFWQDWNKTSNKKLPYLAFEELDEHILEQADESNGREFMQYYKQMKEGAE